MPIEILMPALSPTMTEGNLAKWTKKEGDKVKAGDVIAEIETDKATMEVESIDDGVMGKHMVPAGAQGVKVNELIALLLAEGENKKALESYKPKAGAAANKNVKEEPKQAVQQVAASAGASSSAQMQVGTIQNYGSSPMASGKTRASPLAKRIAQEKGVNLAAIQGTGPHGRVVRADVEEFKGGSARGQLFRNPVETSAIPNNQIRRVIAKKLTEAKQTVPHFYLTIECELDKLLDIRKDLNEEAGEKPAYKISVNDMIIKASALALRKVPAANASWTDEAILRYNNIDISVAVAIDGGLITPIIKNADQKSVIEISGEMKALAAKARAGKLQPEEFQGGGFSISNLGMYGIKHFAAIVNPPQGAILAVGAGEEKVITRGGQIKTANIMEVTLSVDHRVVDGAVGAEFLAAFKGYIEKPSLLLI